MVSSILYFAGDAVIIKLVLQLPPNESCNILVNLLFLNDACLFSLIDLITFPNSLND